MQRSGYDVTLPLHGSSYQTNSNAFFFKQSIIVRISTMKFFRLASRKIPTVPIIFKCSVAATLRANFSSINTPQDNCFANIITAVSPGPSSVLNRVNSLFTGSAHTLMTRSLIALYYFRARAQLIRSRIFRLLSPTISTSHPTVLYTALAEIGIRPHAIARAVHSELTRSGYCMSL